MDAATERGVLVVNAPTSNIHSAAEHAIACCWPRPARSRPPMPPCATTPGSGRRSRAPRSSARPSAWWGWAASASWSPSGWPPSAPTSSPTTRTCRLPAPPSWASNCCSLDELLARADFISVHLPKTPETAGLIGKEALAKTKPGVIIVNAARGGLIDEAALAEAITSGHVRGGRYRRVRQRAVHRQPAVRAAAGGRHPAPGSFDRRGPGPGRHRRRRERAAGAGRRIRSRTRSTSAAASSTRKWRPWLDLVRKLGVLAAALADELPASLSVQVRGELAAEDVEVLKLSALRGLFSAVIEEHGDVRQRAGAGRGTRRRGRDQHGHRKPQPPQRGGRARGGRRGLAS